VAYAKTSLRREKRELREKMRGMGLDYRDIAAEFARRYNLRPRAAWREAYGWSLQDAAARINGFTGETGLDPGGFAGMTGPHLCEYESWPGHGAVPSGRRPTPYLLALLAAVYGCAVTELVDLADREHLPPADLLILDRYTQPAAQPIHPSAGIRAPSQNPRNQQNSIDRRDELAEIGSGLMADAMLGPSAASSRPAHHDEASIKPASPDTAWYLDAGGEYVQVCSPADPAAIMATGLQGPVAPELVGYFACQLAGHYSADRFLGPMRLIPTALSQYELLCEVAGAAASSLRRDLWSVAAGYAGLIGWLYQDGGDLGASARWHNVMIERAHRSQDTQLVAFALHCKAMLHMDMKDGRGVLDLAGAGLRQQERLCPKVRVLLLQQAAHGMSLARGDDAADECSRLLDEAAGLVDAINDGYPWGGNSRTPRYVDVQRATICTRLGRSREALGHWDHVIPDIPASSRRDLGVYRARQAQALAAVGEPEQAVTIATELVPLAAQTGSARMRAELAGLRRSMRPWKTQPPGQALEEALASIGRA
jgi:hypothetical protein